MEATWDPEDTVDIALARIAREQADMQKKIDTGHARQRYLGHLAQSRNEDVIEEEEQCCVLCRCEFVRGYITQWCALDICRQVTVLTVRSAHMYSARYDMMPPSHVLSDQWVSRLA